MKEEFELLKKKEGILLLSFFTGAGFLDIGFLQKGFNIIWHNENNPEFVYAFETGMNSLGYKGLSSKIQNTKSIIDLGPNEIFNDIGQNIKSDLFGIIGGPPCPDFSVGGKNQGHKGDHGRLSEVYVNRILELNPSFFLFENVPGLLRTSKHRAFLSNLLDKLSSKYVLDMKILNALEFGVPQDRERIILIGFNKKWLKKKYSVADFNEILHDSEQLRKINDMPVKKFFSNFKHWFPWPVIPEYVNAKKRFNWPKVPSTNTDKLDGINCPRELMVGTVICDSIIDNLANGNEAFKPRSDKFNRIIEGDVSRKSFKRLHRFRYSPAAAYGNNEVHLHPILPRRITVREALRIQSVPDNYILPKDMSLTAKFKTIGNGVPVRLASVIAEAIYNYIRPENNETI